MGLIERVTTIVHGVVTSVVMPSFRSLRPEDIHSKDTPGDPDDLVTIVDKAAERYLIDALREVVPGAAFIGEEAVCEDASLLEALSATRRLVPPRRNTPPSFAARKTSSSITGCCRGITRLARWRSLKRAARPFM